MTIRIVAPHFVAGIILSTGRVITAAPILAYMLGWSMSEVVTYCRRRRWQWRIVPSSTDTAAREASMPTRKMSAYSPSVRGNAYAQNRCLREVT